MAEYPKLMNRFIAENEQKGGRVLHIDTWEGTNCVKHTGVMDFQGWQGLALFECETVGTLPPTFKAIFAPWDVIEKARAARKGEQKS